MEMPKNACPRLRELSGGVHETLDISVVSVYEPYLLEEVLADVESAESGELLLVLVLVPEVGLLDLHLVARVLLSAVLKVTVPMRIK